MIKRLKVKYQKMMAYVMIIGAIYISVFDGAFANEVQSPQVSSWAVSVLNEGEKYGVFPINWYYEGFLEPISEQKVAVLLEGVSAKLEALHLPLNDAFKPLETGMKTRGDILTLLYNEVAKYQFPKEIGVTEYSPTQYFSMRGILNGTTKGLALEEPVTVEQAVVFATRLIEDTYETTGVGAKGFMWEVNNKKSTMYLFGSIHVGKGEMYPLDLKVKHAFAASDMLIVEANLLGAGQGAEEFMTLATYQDGTTLKDHISEQAYEKTVKVLESFDLPKDQYIQFKPWSIANDLNAIASSYSNSLEGAQEAALLGVDMYFITSAATKQMPVAELEGLKYQGQLFDNLSIQEQERYLVSVVDEILEEQDAILSGQDEVKQGEVTGDEIELLQEYWYDGEYEDFKQTLQSSDSEFSTMIFGKRDENMVQKLSILLEKEEAATYFVVVGSGHLVLDGMVIDQLEQKGYDIKPFYPY